MEWRTRLDKEPEARHASAVWLPHVGAERRRQANPSEGDASGSDDGRRDGRLASSPLGGSQASSAPTAERKSDPSPGRTGPTHLVVGKINDREEFHPLSPAGSRVQPAWGYGRIHAEVRQDRPLTTRHRPSVTSSLSNNRSGQAWPSVPPDPCALPKTPSVC